MSNLTISIDETDLKQARIAAVQQGTSLNAIIRDFIKDYISRTPRYQRTTNRLLQKAEQSSFTRIERRWTREELYER